MLSKSSGRARLQSCRSASAQRRSHPLCRFPSLILPIPNVRKVSRNRRRCRHHRTHQMRPSPSPLPSFKIPVAGRRAPLSRLQNIRIHSQAHRASRLAPLKSRILKNPVQALPAPPPASRFAIPAPPSLALSNSHDDRGPRALLPAIFKLRIRARSNEHAINVDIFNPPPRLQPHVLQSQLCGPPVRIFQSPTSGTAR